MPRALNGGPGVQGGSCTQKRAECGTIPADWPWHDGKNGRQIAGDKGEMSVYPPCSLKPL